MLSSVSLLLPADLLLRGPHAGSHTIGLLAPLSGLMGVAGPAILNCAQLAAEESNERARIPLELVLLDAGRGAADVAREVAQLVGAGLVDGLVGTHTSNVRAAVEAVVGDRVPYIFTPSHEVTRRESGAIFLGNDPDEQIRQPLAWLTLHRRVSRWALIGNDYVWPRRVHTSASRILRGLHQRVVLERLVPVGHVDVPELVDAARAAGADAMLISLVGRDLIEFQRGLVDLGAAGQFVRLCTALDENCLVSAGGDSSGFLFAAMPSFILQADDRHLRLLEAYTARFGARAPLPGSFAEGCYDGVNILAALLASGLLPGATPARAVGQLFTGGDRGNRMTADQRRLKTRRPVTLAQALETELHVVGDPFGR
ncbi:MAG: ABC transporter substrate-binding protein [Burkholderiaceae bacterium]|nr:ABC transporter substrate-binding protein [Microbacteriaceae bacterium]